jgi:flagellar hook assembly protein FlgD
LPVNELQSAGVRTIEWNGRNAAGLQVATGVYFYRLDATSVSGGTAYTNLKKMLLVK